MVSILPPQIVRMDDLEGVPPPWALEKMGIRPLGSNSYALDEKQPIIRERQSELEHALEYWSDWLTESGATVQTHVRYEMSLRSTAASILHAASELDADVIAMRTHARRGLSRAMTGSVADEILRMSTVPILLYTTQTLDAQAEAIPAASLEIKITSS